MMASFLDICYKQLHHCSDLERSVVKDQVERQVVEMMMQDEDEEADKWEKAHGDKEIV